MIDGFARRDADFEAVVQFPVRRGLVHISVRLSALPGRDGEIFVHNRGTGDRPPWTLGLVLSAVSRCAIGLATFSHKDRDAEAVSGVKMHRSTGLGRWGIDGLIVIAVGLILVRHRRRRGPDGDPRWTS